jgi:hypothetical protein
MKNRFALFTILALLLCVSFGESAFSADFSASTHEKIITTCSCRNIEYKLSVRNTGDFVAGFLLEQEGQLARYSTLVPNGFVLQPGETEEVTVFLNVPCNIEGSFPLKTRVTNDLNTEKSFTQHIRVQKCSNVEFEVVKSAERGCRCSAFEYGLELTNTGVFSEVFSLSIEGANASFSENDFELSAGQTKAVKLTVVPPCEWKARELPLSIVTKYTQLRHKVQLDLPIDEECSAIPYSEPSYTLWIIIGLAVLLLWLSALAIVVLYKKRRKGQGLMPKPRPSLYELKLEEKTSRQKLNVPWKKLIAIIAVLIVLGAAAYFAYKYVPGFFEEEPEIDTGIAPGPPMFVIGGGENESEEEEQAEAEFEEPEAIGNVTGPIIMERGDNYWIYAGVWFVLLVTATIVFYKADSHRPARVLHVLKRVCLVLTILLGLGAAGYFVYTLLARYGFGIAEAVWGFLVLYWVYIAAGFGILLVLLMFAVLKNKTQKESPARELEFNDAGYICEFCGKPFKTMRGLKGHIKAKH